ncbi:hypothetical protein N180_17335 [Pedobacter antarcticus 4BY]|uniref:Carbohydrate-binding protein SusD n=2 Tax=Pedobacter antarcticus TaxID=34086 RepID=A0A081PFY1_9SPHI|nr:RagB/SusD family nutrient uptake outer membrane protein [Pedobacter antarcticus]KEQ29604.1 hypothetical protein N180_17335 [Pedobacter antarcticus 4BY]SFE93431.1 RagB/SusD domain-containing protein [Pedobacter antarcticus]
MRTQKITLTAAYLFSLTLLLGSCKKYLDVVPNNALPTASAIIDAGTARAAIIGTYDGLQNYYSADYPTLGTITADNVIFNGTLSEYLQLDQNAIPTDNVITVSAYRKIYRMINSANGVIAGIPGVNDPLLTPEEKNKILGEAYFLRAIGYFDLGRGWGGVQIQLNPTVDLNALKGVKRSTLAQTYDQVLADLVKAEELLPADDANTRNRAQKSTARALRARLNLYRENWTEAEAYATQVINQPKFKLVDNYKTFFTSPFLSSESVLELSFSANDRNSFWNLWYPSSSGGQFTLKPSDGFVAKINNPAIGGSRKSLVAGSGTTVYGVLYNTAGVSVDPAYLIRIAELYLIRAESRANSGNLDGARADLNVIRTRAGVAPLTGGNKEQVLQAIADENSLEFAFEAHRWFDLTRTKKTGEVLGVTNPNFWLFPIPYSDILSDPDVVQNPGY